MLHFSLTSSVTATISSSSSFVGIPCAKVRNKKKTYQAPACIYTAERDLSIAGMYTQSGRRGRGGRSTLVPASGCSLCVCI